MTTFDLMWMATGAVIIVILWAAVRHAAKESIKASEEKRKSLQTLVSELEEDAEEFQREIDVTSLDSTHAQAFRADLDRRYQIEMRRIATTALHMRAKVSRVTVIRGGEVSVVLRFGIEDKDRALELSPGALVSVADLRTPQERAAANVQPASEAIEAPETEPDREQPTP